MSNARQNILRLWKRLVAALSLIAAAALAPAMAAPLNGGGMAAPRAGSGAALANSANALMANVAGIVEGGQQAPRLEASGDPPAKACMPPPRHAFSVAWAAAAPLPVDTGTPPALHEARSGPTRAPPAG
jgi:hypothetical protein